MAEREEREERKEAGDKVCVSGREEEGTFWREEEEKYSLPEGAGGDDECSLKTSPLS